MRYSTVSFKGCFFKPSENAVLISPIDMMPTSCVLLYCLQHSQVFLQPQLVPHKQNTFCLNYYNNFVTARTSQRTFSTPIVTRTIQLVVI